VDPDLVYRRVPGLELHLDLVRPAGPGPFPVLVGFHLGPYAPRARTELREECLWYARNGFAAASVEYRGPVKWAYPTPVEDGRAALAFVRAHAAEYGLDASRVGVFGRKIGGWVALHLLLASPADGSPRPLAGVVGYAPTDLADAAFDANPHIGRLREILTGNPTKDAVARASPLTYAGKGDPPLFVFHSPKDLAIPSSQSERLVAALKAAGCDATLLALTGGGHGADCVPQTAADAADLETIRTKSLEFLRRVLRVESAPPR
jgi:acetyl esterase/lipase